MKFYECGFQSTERFNKVVDLVAIETKELDKYHSDADPVDNDYAYNFIAGALYAMLACGIYTNHEAKSDIVCLHNSNSLSTCDYGLRLSKALPLEKSLEYARLLRDLFYPNRNSWDTFYEMFFGNNRELFTGVLNRCFAKVYSV